MHARNGKTLCSIVRPINLSRGSLESSIISMPLLIFQTSNHNTQKALIIYRITLLESCSDLKIKLEKIWNQHNNDKALSIYISNKGDESRLLIKEQNFKFRKSLMALIFFESQGVILILLIILVLICLITLFRIRS